jgi:hypothetical protein
VAADGIQTRESDWTYLKRLLKTRTVDPLSELPFLIYVFLGIILFGGLGIWTELLKYILSDRTDLTGLFKGQQMVVAVFETFASEPKSFLPRDTYQTYLAGGQTERVICDHVAGMTDSFLLKTYERLFSPRLGSVFDKL